MSKVRTLGLYNNVFNSVLNTLFCFGVKVCSNKLIFSLFFEHIKIH